MRTDAAKRGYILRRLSAAVDRGICATSAEAKEQAHRWAALWAKIYQR